MENKRDWYLPNELQELLKLDTEARTFFLGLSDGYKRIYCNWINGAKSEKTKHKRADEALKMLQNKQKTLKIVRRI